VSCESYRQDASRWRDGELPLERREELARHLRACGACAESVRAHHEPTCKALAEFLAEYLEDALAPAQRAVFELHMGRCPGCVDYVRSYEATIGLTQATLGTARSLASLPPMPDDLVRAILDARQARS
jgi:anti-sigma factor RsiW